jgi:hypothetical protein
MDKGLEFSVEIGELVTVLCLEWIGEYRFETFKKFLFPDFFYE